MHVGGYDAALYYAFGAYLSVSFSGTVSGCAVGIAVSYTPDHAPEWGGVGTKDGGTHVVFKAGECVGEFWDSGWGGDELADGAFPKGAGGGVDESNAVDDAPVGAEGFAEDLQPGAYGEDGSPEVGGFDESPVFGEVFCCEDLCGVFAAADAVEVQVGGHGFAKFDGHDLRVNAALAGASPQDQGVAVVAVGA